MTGFFRLFGPNRRAVRGIDIEGIDEAFGAAFALLFLEFTGHQAKCDLVYLQATLFLFLAALVVEVAAFDGEVSVGFRGFRWASIRERLRGVPPVAEASRTGTIAPVEVLESGILADLASGGTGARLALKKRLWQARIFPSFCIALFAGKGFTGTFKTISFVSLIVAITVRFARATVGIQGERADSFVANV